MICYAISQLFAAYFFTNTNTMSLRAFLLHTHSRLYNNPFICAHAHKCIYTCVSCARVLFYVVLHAACIGNDDVFIYTCKFVVESLCFTLCCSFAQAHRPSDRITKKIIGRSKPSYPCVCVYRGVCTV